jgi:hypothetical protein
MVFFAPALSKWAVMVAGERGKHGNLKTYCCVCVCVCVCVCERERDLYWINSKESPLASVTASGLAMLLLPQ